MLVAAVSGSKVGVRRRRPLRWPGRKDHLVGARPRAIFAATVEQATSNRRPGGYLEARMTGHAPGQTAPPAAGTDLPVTQWQNRAIVQRTAAAPPPRRIRPLGGRTWHLGNRPLR